MDEQTRAQCQEIVNSGIKANEDKNTIVGKLFTASGADLAGAFKLYNELAKTSGLLLSKEQKAQAVDEIAKQHTKDNVLDRKAAVTALVERGRMSKSTADQKLREYCEEHDIGFPLATRQKRNLEAVKAAIKQWHEQGVEKASIIAGLVQHFQYSENSAADAYRKYGKELGFLKGRVSDVRTKIAAWFWANGTGEKKEVVKNLANDFNLTVNTADAYYGMFLFAKAYVKACQPAEEPTELYEVPSQVAV